MFSSISCFLSLLSLTGLAVANTIITGSIQPSPHLLDVGRLPASTLLTLYTTGVQNSRETLLLADNTFIFRNVSQGSYLLDVNCQTHLFMPLRVDVKSGDVVEVYGTYRGNEWSNLGERKTYPIELRAAKAVEFFVTRETFNPLKMLNNPMILIALFSVGFLFLMPKIVDNMDPEMKEEYEKTRRESPLTNPSNPLQNFDMAGFLAGKSSGTGGATGVDSGRSTPKGRR